MSRYLPMMLAGMLVLAVVAGSPASAQDSEDNSRKAVAAARVILDLAGQNKLNTLWNGHASAWFKSRTNKDVFIQNMSIGRSQFGPPQSVRLVNVAYANAEQDFRGDIYTVTFETSYPAGKFFERIIVIKERDGEFRLSGLWGAPAPRD